MDHARTSHIFDADTILISEINLLMKLFKTIEISMV